MYVCENCNKEFFIDWRKDIRKSLVPRFCSPSCSRSYSSKTSTNKKKIISCIKCGNLLNVDCHIFSKTFICENCKKYYISYIYDSIV